MAGECCVLLGLEQVVVAMLSSWLNNCLKNWHSPPMPSLIPKLMFAILHGVGRRELLFRRKQKTPGLWNSFHSTVGQPLMVLGVCAPRQNHPKLGIPELSCYHKGLWDSCRKALGSSQGPPVIFEEPGKQGKPAGCTGGSVSENTWRRELSALCLFTVFFAL